MIDVLMPADSMVLTQEAIEPFDILKDAVYPVGTIHNMDFQKMVEEHRVDHGESLLQAENVDFSDLHYNGQRSREDEHLS